jgi:ribosomal protein L32
MRLTKGIDIWICSDCGEAVIMGRLCPTCGNNYADQLKAEHSKSEKTKKKKYREPAEKREFTESFLFRKGKKK